jgi:hypothetical protein
VSSNPQDRPSQPFVYKSRLVSFLAGFIGVVFAIGAGGAAAELVPESAKAAVGVPVGVVLVALVVHRVLGVSLIVDEDGVCIRNFFSVVELPWSEIGEISGVNVTGSIAVLFVLKKQRHKVLIDGRHAMATQFGGSKERKRELLTVLREHAAAHGIPCKVDLRKNGTFYTRENWPEHLRG